MTDITWTRPAGCDTNACAEWRQDGDRVWLRSSRLPGRAIHLDVDEFWQLIDAAVNGEVVVGDA